MSNTEISFKLSYTVEREFESPISTWHGFTSSQGDWKRSVNNWIKDFTGSGVVRIFDIEEVGITKGIDFSAFENKEFIFGSVEK